MLWSVGGSDKSQVIKQRYAKIIQSMIPLSDLKECTYKIASAYMLVGDYKLAFKEFEKITGYKDVDEKLKTDANLLNVAPVVQTIRCPVPGTVIEVMVNKGQRIRRGDRVLMLEAMMMENEILAPWDGIVASVDVTKGIKVAAGDVLATISESKKDL